MPNAGNTLGPGGKITVQVGGAGGRPANIAAGVMNTTVTNTTDQSFLTVWPNGQTQPL